MSLIVKEGFEDLRSAYKIGGVSVEMGTVDFGRSRKLFKGERNEWIELMNKRKKGFGIFGFCDEREREKESRKKRTD